jgi:hypothetical protein
VAVGRKKGWMKFFLMGLGKDRIILGYLFLTKFDPSCDWKIGHLREGWVKIQTINPQAIIQQTGKLKERKGKAHLI